MAIFSARGVMCFLYSVSLHIYPVPKLAATLHQTCLIQFVVHAFQRNIVHCTILTLLTLTPIMTYALCRLCSV